LSGRGLCDELITRPEESYRLCCVVMCDLETSRRGAPYIYDISNLRVKRRAINLRDWCIWLVDLFDCMMMHGLANPQTFKLCMIVHNLDECHSSGSEPSNAVHCMCIAITNLTYVYSVIIRPF